MDESWTGALSLIGGAVLGYVTHYLQARTPTKDNDRALEDNAIGRDATRRTEALEHFRWAAELAVSTAEVRRQLGVDQLKNLVRSSHLGEEDVQLVRAAIRSALAPELRTWETGETQAFWSEEEKP